MPRAKTCYQQQPANYLSASFQIFGDFLLHQLRIVPGLPDDNLTVSADQISDVGPRTIGAPYRIIDLVNQHRQADFFGSCGLLRQFQPLLIGLRLTDRIAFLIRTMGTCPLPAGIGADKSRGMCLNGVNNNKMDAITIGGIQIIIGSAPLPEGWSGKGTKNDDHRFLIEELGETDRIPLNIL